MQEVMSLCLYIFNVDFQHKIFIIISMVENIAVVIPEHTLSDIDKKPFVNR
jgi:hypothetical protein